MYDHSLYFKNIMSKKKNIVDKNALLTVIIPTYNRAKELNKTLKKLINNKNSKICFLILNNNSTDNTLSVINKIKSQDKRISVINNKKNIGISRSLKKGLEKFNTPFCTIVSDDDIVIGNYLNYVIKIFNNYKSVNLVHHELGNFSSKNNKNYKIYDVGIDSSSNAFNLSSVITGLSFRKSCLNFSKYPKNPDLVYIHLPLVLSATKKGKFAQIYNCGFKELNKKKRPKNRDEEIKLIEKWAIRQVRPPDWGISEIIRYVEKSNYNSYDKMKILQKKIIWFSAITEIMPEKIYKTIIINTKNSLGNYFIFYYIYLLIYRFDINILKLLIYKLLLPKNFKFRLFELVLLFKYIYKKVLNI
jgi:glycosyltransferase involved in cell wall biosynthesis